MLKWMSGMGAALLASLVWFPLTSTTQDPRAASLDRAPKEIGGLRVEVDVEKLPPARCGPDGSDTRVTFKYSNPGGAAVHRKVKILLQETKINPMARMMPRPVVVWEKETEISLEPGKDGSLAMSHEKFSGLLDRKDVSDGRSRTLREIVVVCGEERATLFSNSSLFVFSTK